MRAIGQAGSDVTQDAGREATRGDFKLQIADYRMQSAETLTAESAESIVE
jgi:hypothetical protein